MGVRPQHSIAELVAPDCDPPRGSEGKPLQDWSSVHPGQGDFIECKYIHAPSIAMIIEAMRGVMTGPTQATGMRKYTSVVFKLDGQFVNSFKNP
jgi:hypothetical protein